MRLVHGPRTRGRGTSCRCRSLEWCHPRPWWRVSPAVVAVVEAAGALGVAIRASFTQLISSGPGSPWSSRFCRLRPTPRLRCSCSGEGAHLVGVLTVMVTLQLLAAVMVPALVQLVVRHQTEVSDLDDALGREVDVGGLEVPVDEALAVDILHPGADLTEHAVHLLSRHGLSRSQSRSVSSKHSCITMYMKDFCFMARTVVSFFLDFQSHSRATTQDGLLSSSLSSLISSSLLLPLDISTFTDCDSDLEKDLRLRSNTMPPVDSSGISSFSLLFSLSLLYPLPVSLDVFTLVINVSVSF